MKNNKNKIIVIIILLIVGIYGVETASMNVGSIGVENIDLLDNKIIEVDPCDLSGDRMPSTKVDIGMDTPLANREYYAYTNEYGQLIYVEADNIIAQDDELEEKYERGDERYCSDEAKVPGVESSELDEGHVIADSLGGVSNAYNITPQDSQLNRTGAQAELEEEMREELTNGSEITDFSAEITYPDSITQIPNHYHIEYYIDNELKIYDYDNE